MTEQTLTDCFWFQSMASTKKYYLNHYSNRILEQIPADDLTKYINGKDVFSGVMKYEEQRHLHLPALDTKVSLRLVEVYFNTAHFDIWDTQT